MSDAAKAPEGLSSTAPVLPAQNGTERRADASGVGTSSELHAVSERGGHILAVVDASDRHGAVLGNLHVTRWPVVVGRALDSDLILDEAHLAAKHLELHAGTDDSVRGFLTSQVNGALLEGEQLSPGQEFVWRAGQSLCLGRIRLGLRMRATPLPAEQPFEPSSGTELARSSALLVLLLALSVFVSWLDVREPDRFTQTLPVFLVGLGGVVALWSAAWALMSKLFSGRPQFLRHVRIACTTLLLSQLSTAVLQMLAFMLSWAWMARFENHATSIVLATGIWFHLRAIAPQRGRMLGMVVVALAALGLGTTMGSQWLQNQRLSSQMYMTALFPPQLRLVEGVPAKQFVDELADLRPALDKRLKDGSAENAEDDSDD